MNAKSVWNTYDEAALAALDTLNDNYRRFISKCKTERECVAEAIRMAKAKGYVGLDTVIAEGKK